MTTLAQLPSLAKYSEYRPENLGWSARDPEKDGSLLVPFSHSGVSFGSMHRDVVSIFTALLDELVPLIPGGLVKGTCGCYNPKSVTGSGKRSFHTYAIAVDVNWSANPMNVPLRTGPHTMPKAAAALARKYGCVWGGTWTDPIDCMHLEVHLTPAQARAFQPPQEDDVSQADVIDALNSTAGQAALQKAVWHYQLSREADGPKYLSQSWLTAGGTYAGDAKAAAVAAATAATAAAKLATAVGDMVAPLKKQIDDLTAQVAALEKSGALNVSAASFPATVTIGSQS